MRRREWLVRLLLVVAPFALLGLLEVLLRLTGAAAPPPLVEAARTRDGEVWRLNPTVAQRYFDPRAITLPTLAPQTFLKDKPDDVLRIFCLGGSTTAGFPFDAQVPFPAQLQLLLDGIDPDRRVEVINLGISAVNSFTVWDLMPEVLELDPDLLIVYMGHNEFYGAYGSGSTIGIGGNPSWVRVYLKLQHWRLVRILKRGIQAVLPAPAPPDRDATLMEKVSADRAIPFGSPRYRKTLDAFQDNLTRILDMAGQAGVPVLLGNLVANEADQPPFGSDYSADLSATARQEVEGLLRRGGQLFAAGDMAAALTVYREAAAIDTAMPDLWYRLGQIHERLGDTTAAVMRYRGARDRDRVRFRASGAANDRIAAVAAASGVHLVDLDAVFRAAAPGGLLGNALFCDHLHPNPAGYFLMARTFLAALVEQGLLAGDAIPPLPDRPILVGDIDWEIGMVKVFRLKHRWPFPERALNFDRYRAVGHPEAVRIARDYVETHHNWRRAQYEMAAVWEGEGRINRAAERYQAVAAMLPGEADPLIQLGNLAKGAGDWRAAADAYRQALERAPGNGLIHYHLALVLRRSGSLDGAIEHMRTAAADRALTAEQRVNARFYLAGFLVAAGRRDEAVALLLELRRDHPDFAPAATMLRQLGQPLPQEGAPLSE